MVFSENRALRFAGTEAPYLRRSTKGNYSMSTTHPMKGMVCVRPNANALAIITAGGRINKIPLVSIKNGKRTQAGSSVIKLGKGDNITTDVLLRICTALNCQISDILETLPDEETKNNEE